MAGVTKEEKIKQKNERTGMVNINHQGSEMKIIDYKDYHNITIMFNDEYQYTMTTRLDYYLKGKPSNPYAPSVYGVGILGTEYKATINEKNTKEYDAWVGILKRCYDEKYQEKSPRYKGCTICDEWKYYPIFHDWLHSQDNFTQWKKSNRSAVDKDILVKGNKHYSPETCCLVFDNINSLFVKNDSRRGEYPIGVHYNKANGKYHAKMNDGTRHTIHIGFYNTSEEAFYAYKREKGKLIKDIAERDFKLGNITKQCYDAMIKYQVEITD